MLKEITRPDVQGREIMRVSFFDLNESHETLPHERGELLPGTYWETE